MKLEIVVLATLVAAACPEWGSAQGVSALPPSGPMRLYDATGKFVSSVEPDNPLRVILNYADGPIDKPSSFALNLQIDTTGDRVRWRWLDSLGPYFMYESTDCSGQPYVDPRQLLPGRRVALLDTGIFSNRLYLSEPDPPVVLRTLGSRRYAGQKSGCLANSGPFSMRTVTVQPVADMDDVFTLPFRVQ
ncbi:MAG: hypothetical protein ABW221_27815 [Vicinamibacteria bacterium]